MIGGSGVAATECQGDLTVAGQEAVEVETEGGAPEGRGVWEGGSPIPDPARLSPRRPAPPRRIRLRDEPAPSWSQRCELLFEDLRRPARAMVSRAYGRALNDDQLDDVYAAAWAATLSALRGRGEAMTDDELRAYVFTAVASHASKELRRRSRKPTGTLDDAHEQVLYDVHAPLPDETAIGSETGSVARDLLSSLPPRRRAVMLLRYGWGMSPTEVCVLVKGLSPRAYRKEITRGVEELIQRLKEVETGEWCESRQPLIRDYVAGIAGEDETRQAVQHVEHCRACADLVARLSGHLHELGGSVALASVAESIGGGRLPFVDRIGSIWERGRETTTAATERTEEVVRTVAASGGARGSGAAGAGVVAKLAGLGVAGKTAAVCIGTGAAATACVVAGVVPGVQPIDLGGDVIRPVPPKQESKPPEPETSGPVSSAPEGVTSVAEAAVSPEAPTDEGTGGEGDRPVSEIEQAPTAPEGAPAESPAPTAPPADQEFVVPAAEPVAPAPAPSTEPTTSPDASGGSEATGSEIGQEFGP